MIQIFKLTSFLCARDLNFVWIGGSVLGLLLSQGAEWKIQIESQHKEWKNMTQK